MKLALLLSAIDPNIGGVIIMGHRGTGKSTGVRGLADLLPQNRKVRGCLYGCDPDRLNELCQDCADRLSRDGRLPAERGAVPVVDLPLGATEDRVCGTLDIERALVEGVKAFEPGLLARANRGFLYIDEVNLLDDHLVDALLDAAASGRNVVEREGISVTHPARFVLVGSGNPDEGELRPQLLDRFGLYTQITTITDIEERVEIVQRRERFDDDPVSFLALQAREQDRLRRRITRGRKLLARVEIDHELLMLIATLCVSLKVDGHRGELTIARAARSLAAFEGREKAKAADVERVAVMSLRHRLRRDPLETVDSGARIEQALSELIPMLSTKARLRVVK
jgi:magnesium chelatase subunit I